MDKNTGELKKIVPINMWEFREKGAEVYGKLKLEADGTVKHDVTFQGIVHLAEETRRTEIVWTESEDALLGSELLDDYVLEVDDGNRTVEIRESLMNREA